MRFNVNDKVHVRLTAEGRKILRRQRFVVEERDGWSCWQLWELMARLGVHCHLSADPPFEPDIELQPGWK